MKGHRPWHVLDSTEMLALAIPVPALLGTLSGSRVWSQLTHRGLVLHPEYSLVSANWLSVFHGQFLKGPGWLNKSLNNSRAIPGSGLRDSCSPFLVLTGNPNRIQMERFSEKMIQQQQETDTYTGDGPEIKSITSSTADLIQLFEAVWNYGGGLSTILPFLSNTQIFMKKSQITADKKNTPVPQQKTEVTGPENSQGSIYQLMLWSEKWWFFHLSCPYLLSVQGGLLRLGNELGIWAGDKGLFS